ncbi:MAG: succinate dehydrogenase cytochrome b subunit [Acidobacteriota bacterium]
MSSLRSRLRSSVGKKILMAVSGLLMGVFLVLHLAGNLALFTGDADAYNKYSHFLLSLGELLLVAEAGLILFLLVHVVSGISVALGRRRARPVGYQGRGHAGGPSRKTLSSRTMIWTGVVILVFTVVHLKTFKFGPGVAEGYVTHVDGVQMRDLHRLVMDDFSQPGYVAFYVGCMLFLGFHLRHGFWSALQSLGAQSRKTAAVTYTAGAVFALLLALGFLVLPLWIYVTGGSP